MADLVSKVVYRKRSSDCDRFSVTKSERTSGLSLTRIISNDAQLLPSSAEGTFLDGVAVVTGEGAHAIQRAVGVLPNLTSPQSAEFGLVIVIDYQYDGQLLPSIAEGTFLDGIAVVPE